MNIFLYTNVAHDECNLLMIIGTMNVNVICVAKVISMGMHGRVGSMGCKLYIAHEDPRKF